VPLITRKSSRALSRRQALVTGLAIPAIVSSIGQARAATILKISHQAPGGTIDKGDIRDRMCLRFAAEIAKRSGGDLAAQVYPGASLMKPQGQWSAMRKGALDLSMYPIAAAGGESPEANIGLLPSIVSSYEDAYGWKGKPIGKALTDYIADKGIVVVSWLWLAGGIVSRNQKMIAPDDVKGFKLRGGSREMDMVLKQAGAAVLSLPSTELYTAMQTGACDAAITSASSMQSFRLVETAKHLSFGKKSFWYIFGPLLMSKIIFDGLPKMQQDIIMQAGADMETFGLEGARAEDAAIIETFKSAGLNAYDFDDASLDKWKSIARETAWKDFADKSETAARLLKLATES